MENNPDFENNTDLNNLFLELIKDDNDKELLKLIMRNDRKKDIYDLILNELRKRGGNDKAQL
jgi:hypothetical protein